MKYTLSLLALMFCVAAQAVTTPWVNYPTTNTFGDTDTFILGNGSTNLTILGLWVKTVTTNTAQAIANTTSNSLNTSINTSSNAVLGNAQTAINTSSNSLNTSINTSSNSVLGNAQTAINTSSNAVLGNAQTAINTSSNSLNTSINTSSNLNFANTITVINTSSNLVFGNALTQINTTSNSLQSQIIAGGVTAVTATNISQSIANTSSNLVYGNALTQINATSNSLNTSINTSSNAVYANGIIADTNVTRLVSPMVLGGANITSTPAYDATTGRTNFTAALNDPATLSQINVGTAWLTNTVIPTNTFSGTVVNMGVGFGVTNLGGNLTFTDVSGVTAGAQNTAIVRLFSGGADRTIAFPVSWHTNYGFIGVVTNGWQMDLMVTVTTARTNVAQILYP